MRVLAVGETGRLAEVDSAAAVLALHAGLSRSSERPPGVTDVVPAARTVLVHFDPRRVGAAEVDLWLRAAEAGDVDLSDAAGTSTSTSTIEATVEPMTGPTTEVTIEVTYDGEDLEDVGRLTGLGVDGVVAAHSGTSWTVAFTGFAPGFGYLVGGDPALTVPRLEVPRTRVPAGAVALAGPYTGVYPRSSPGGWRLIGRTDARIWDLDRDPPALLQPGAVVTFVAAR